MNPRIRRLVVTGIVLSLAVSVVLITVLGPGRQTPGGETPETAPPLGAVTETDEAPPAIPNGPPK